jgi:hypothetical protein
MEFATAVNVPFHLHVGALGIGFLYHEDIQLIQLSSQWSISLVICGMGGGK